MATKGRQRACSNGYEIEVIPNGGAGARGSVHDDSGSPIAPWSYSGTGEVWVDVGETKSGTVKEDGSGDEPWKIISI